MVAVTGGMSTRRNTCSCSVSRGRGHDGKLDFNGFTFGTIVGYCGDSPPDDATDDDCDQFVNNPTNRGGHRNRNRRDSNDDDRNCYDYCRYRGGSNDDCVSCCSCCCGAGGRTYRGSTDDCIATTTTEAPTKPTTETLTKPTTKEELTKPTKPNTEESTTRTTKIIGDCKFICIVYCLTTLFSSL